MFALLLIACAHRAPKATAPLDVRITNLPERAQVTCWLPDVPSAPPLKELNYEDDDLVRRVFVHYLDYNALVQWSMETQSWMEEAQRCFNRLTGVEE